MKSTTYHRMAYGKAFGYIVMLGILVMCASLVILFPIFVFGIIIILFSPVLAFMVNEAECPECKANIVFVGEKKSVKCRTCKCRCLVQKQLAKSSIVDNTVNA